MSDKRQQNLRVKVKLRVKSVEKKYSMDTSKKMEVLIKRLKEKGSREVWVVWYRVEFHPKALAFLKGFVEGWREYSILLIIGKNL